MIISVQNQSISVFSHIYRETDRQTSNNIVMNGARNLRNHFALMYKIYF